MLIFFSIFRMKSKINYLYKQHLPTIPKLTDFNRLPIFHPSLFLLCIVIFHSLNQLLLSVKIITLFPKSIRCQLLLTTNCLLMAPHFSSSFITASSFLLNFTLSVSRRAVFHHSPFDLVIL